MIVPHCSSEHEAAVAELFGIYVCQYQLVDVLYETCMHVCMYMHECVLVDPLHIYACVSISLCTCM